VSCSARIKTPRRPVLSERRRRSASPNRPRRRADPHHLSTARPRESLLPLHHGRSLEPHCRRQSCRRPQASRRSHRAIRPEFALPTPVASATGHRPKLANAVAPHARCRVGAAPWPRAQPLEPRRAEPSGRLRIVRRPDDPPAPVRPHKVSLLRRSFRAVASALPERGCSPSGRRRTGEALAAVYPRIPLGPPCPSTCAGCRRAAVPLRHHRSCRRRRRAVARDRAASSRPNAGQRMPAGRGLPCLMGPRPWATWCHAQYCANGLHSSFLFSDKFKYATKL
jgi:hypothetical protein